MNDKHYNLVEQKFLPCIGGKKYSLREIFLQDDAENLSLDEYHYIAIMRLLLCIGQAAVDLKSKIDWYYLTLEDFKQKVTAYLERNINCFDLYGEKPFLQIRELENKKNDKQNKERNLALFIPELRVENNLAIHPQQTSNYSDEEKALHLIAIQLHGIGGSRVDNSIILSPGYKGKKKNGAISPMLGTYGYLYSFYLGRNIAETVWINLLSEEEVQIASNQMLTMGRPCWELEVNGESCVAAEEMKRSYLGRLVPLVRFCLLEGDDIVCTDGIAHLTLDDKVADFTLTTSIKKNKLVAKTPKTESEPWRELPALISFLNKDRTPEKEHCVHLALCYEHCRKANFLAIWSGGIEVVTYTAGDQKICGKNNYISSIFKLNDGNFEFNGEMCFNNYKNQIIELNNKSTLLAKCIANYIEEMKFDDHKNNNKENQYDNYAEVKKGRKIYWSNLNLIKNDLKEIVFSNFNSDEELDQKKQKYNAKVWNILLNAYKTVCPNTTPRAFSAYIKNMPRIK